MGESFGPWSVRWSRRVADDGAPSATYRLQLRAVSASSEAAASRPISPGSASATSTCRRSSRRAPEPHGYDITDHASSIPTRHGAEFMRDDRRRSSARASSAILDFVPNHMGVGGADNPLWLDVLEWGPELALCRMVRHRLGRRAHGKLLAPVLGAQYGEALRRGDLDAEVRRRRSFAIWAYDDAQAADLPADLSARSSATKARRWTGWRTGFTTCRIGGREIAERALELEARLATLARAIP